MLSRLIDVFTPSPTVPSVVLVVGTFGRTIHALHIVPEDGSVDRFSLTRMGANHSPDPPNATFRYGGATEHARERIGAVTLRVGDGESVSGFLEDVERRARTLWNKYRRSRGADKEEGGMEVAELERDVMRPAALDVMREREGRAHTRVNATETYPVYIVQIKRSKPGRLPMQLTSWPAA